jgi:hypothetical protein
MDRDAQDSIVGAVVCDWRFTRARSADQPGLSRGTSPREGPAAIEHGAIDWAGTNS